MAGADFDSHASGKCVYLNVPAIRQRPIKNRMTSRKTKFTASIATKAVTSPELTSCFWTHP